MHARQPNCLDLCVTNVACTSAPRLLFAGFSKLLNPLLSGRGLGSARRGGGGPEDWTRQLSERGRGTPRSWAEDSGKQWASKLVVMAAL